MSTKTWFLHTCFLHFYNNSRSKQNKKNPKLPFEDIIKYKTCSKFQQKTSNFMEVGARQSFQFFRQKPGFLEIIDLCLNFSKQDVNITMCKAQICVVCKHD